MSLTEKYYLGAIGSEYITKDHLHPASNFTLGASRRGHYRTVLHGMVSWICSRESHFFSLSYLIKSHSQVHTNTLYTVEGKHPFHIAMRYIMSQINIERANGVSK